MKQRFVWSSISSDVAKWARHCLACQKSKIHRHTRSPLSSFQEPSQRLGNYLKPKNETPATVEPNATASTPATVESDPAASTPTQPSTRSGRKVHLPTRYR
ncbi:hypothetical protein TNCV_4262171 [Trichonephila clavipes]|nr:hypothetical protein TNCV_4262171 [Trichonephila clavipes]